METIKTDSVAFDHNGKSYMASVTIKVDHDDLDPAGSFDYGDPIENAKELARFESGELRTLFVRVEVSAFGVVTRDSMGGVWVNTHVAESIESQVLDAVTDHDMVANCLTDLIYELKRQAKALEPFA